jgi:3'(2'), 5'-bisphosphate nucleotidase
MLVSETVDFADITLADSRNHRSPKMSRVIKEFGFKGEIQRGSVGLKVGLIAEQTCDAYIHLSPRTKMWDTCAPQIILEEAGGRLTDLWGKEYRYDISDVQNWGGIVATNGLVHEQIIQRLQPLLAEFGRDKIVSPT